MESGVGAAAAAGAVEESAGRLVDLALRRMEALAETAAAGKTTSTGADGLVSTGADGLVSTGADGLVPRAETPPPPELLAVPLRP